MRADQAGTAIVAIACVVLAATCGNSGGSERAPGSNATPTTKPGPAADRTRARSLLLTAGDLPADWRRSGVVENPEDRRDDEKLADCMGAFDPSNDVVRLDGDAFADFSNQVSSSVNVVDTRAHFVADARAIESGRLLACFRTLFSEELPKSIAKSEPGATVHDLKVARLPSATYGEVTVGFRASFTVSDSGASSRLFVDEFEFGAGRDEVSVNFDSEGTPLDATLEQSVLGKAGAKLAKART